MVVKRMRGLKVKKCVRGEGEIGVVVREALQSALGQAVR